jgi:hypothetical protein
MMNVRRALRWCYIVLCLAGVCVGLHFYGEHRLKQARARLARAMSLPALPAACRLPESDSRNAAFWYLSAGSAYLATRATSAGSAYLPTRATRETLDLRPLVNRSPTTWSARDVEQAASGLAELNRTLELAYEASSRPVCEFRLVASNPVYMWETVLERPLLLEVGFQLRQHRLEKAVRAVKVLGDLALGLERQQDALSQMIGTGIERGYLRGLNWILSTPDVPPSLLRSLRAGLPSESAAAALARYFASEAARYANTEGELRVLDRGLLGFCCGDLKVARSLEDFAKIRPWADLPYRQAEQALQAFAGRLETLSRYSWTGLGLTKGESLFFPGGYWLEQIERCKGVAASRQLAALSLSLRIEAATQGAYPERLSADDAKAVDPLVGAHPTYTRTASGGVYLANQRAAAAYSEIGLSRVPPPFEWTLPAPTGTPR